MNPNKQDSIPMPYADDVEAADDLAVKYKELHAEISKVVVGQEEAIRLLIVSIFCQGHSLLVGVPGLAKTLLVQTIAASLDLSFKRIQFTPDLMPSDITGMETMDKERNFKFIKGPIFTHVVLADEINRTPPKTQAALLESMQEHAVTVAGYRHKLPSPFFVLATQNPIEQEGTYPLPEAQLDRFMFNIMLDYPTYDQEIEILTNTVSENFRNLRNILDGEQIKTFQQLVQRVPMADNVVKYLVDIVRQTRPSVGGNIARTYLEWGAGPRASLYLALGAKCYALLFGKYSPDIEDIMMVAKPILRHRIVPNFKAETEGMSADDIIEDILKTHV